MSKGNAPKERAKLLVKVLLEYETNQGDRITNLGVNWAEDGGANLKVSATKQALFNLLKGMPEFRPTLTTKDDQVRKTIGECLTKHLNQFLEILEDHRTQHQKSLGDWSFTLKLWRKVELKNSEEGICKNLEELDRLWEAKRSPQSVAASTNITNSITHGTAIGNIENVENLEIHNNTGGSPAPQPERVATPRRDNGRLRGFNEIRAVTVWEGREQVLAELRQKLRDGLRVLVLTGQGGIGKSSLASKLMEALGIGLQPPSLGADYVYSGVVYFKVQVGTSFDDGAGQLLQDLGEEQGRDLVKPEEKIDRIITYLAGQKWLLVLDNLEDILHPASHEAAGRAVSPEWGQLLNALVSKNHCSQVIITSREMPVDLGDLRYKVKPDSSLVEVVTIPGVSTNAGVEILRKHQLTDKLEDLEWMAARVGGNVFLLKQLASLGRGKPGTLRKKPKLVTKNAETMLTEQLNRQTAAAQDFLARMSILQGAMDSRGLTFMRLFVDEWQERLMASEELLEFSDDEISETEELLEKLVDSSLVESKFNKRKSEDVYSLHQLTKNFLQQKYVVGLPKLMSRIHNFYDVGISNPKTLPELQPILEAQQFAFQLGSYDEAYRLIARNLKKYLEPWGYWMLLKKLCNRILPHLTNKHNRAYTLRLVGYIQHKLGNWQEAEIFVNNALALSEEEGNKRGKAIALGMLGDIARNRGNWDEAEKIYHQCLQLMTELGDRSGMASSWGSLGDIARNWGNWDEAERLYLQCSEVRTELGDRSGMATTSELLGYIANLRGNWDEAERLYLQSLEVRTELGDRSGMASSWALLGSIARNRGNWDEAKRLYLQSLEVRTELGDRSSMARSFGCLGDIARNKMNVDKAIELHQQCLEIMQELGDQRGIAVTNCDLGEDELARDNLDAAERFLTLALKQLEAIGEIQYVGTANYDLAQLWRKRGNLNLAQQHYTTATTIFQNLGAAKDLDRIQQEWQTDG